MKYLKLFEHFTSTDFTRQLANQADISSTMDRLDSSKMVPVNYEGTLYYDKNRYLLEIDNKDNKPYKVKGIPPAPTLFLELIPTEYFTYDDFESYKRLNNIYAYSVNHRDNLKRFKVFGWTIPSENPNSGIEQVVYVTGLENS
jgi:hypothetical protein